MLKKKRLYIIIIVLATLLLIADLIFAKTTAKFGSFSVNAGGSTESGQQFSPGNMPNFSGGNISAEDMENFDPSNMPNFRPLWISWMQSWKASLMMMSQIPLQPLPMEEWLQFMQRQEKMFRRLCMRILL